MRRRHFLTVSAASLGGLLLRSVDGKVLALPPDAQQGQSIRVPLRFFTQSEARTVSAAAARILPSDDSGPGAEEAGVVLYIDRQLAGPWGRDRYRYTQPPFEENAPSELGYQGQATPRQVYRDGLKSLRGFASLSVPEQDQALRQIEKTYFFSLLRQNVIEGMFCDPMHSGNSEMTGWQLVGFPGPRMSNYDEVEKYYGVSFRPQPAGLKQVTGKTPRLSEDEK